MSQYDNPRRLTVTFRPPATKESPMSKSDPVAGVHAGTPFVVDDTLPPGHIAIVSGGKRTLFRIDLDAETATPVFEERWPLRATVANEVRRPGEPFVTAESVDYGNAVRLTYDNGLEGGGKALHWRECYDVGGPHHAKRPAPRWVLSHLLGRPLPRLPD